MGERARKQKGKEYDESSSLLEGVQAAAKGAHPYHESSSSPAHRTWLKGAEP